jgi:hypothetical protein
MGSALFYLPSQALSAKQTVTPRRGIRMNSIDFAGIGGVMLEACLEALN